MEVLLIISVLLLAGNAQSQITRSVNATPTTSGDGTRYFSQTLKCDPDSHVYVVSVQYEYNSQLCTCLGLAEIQCLPFLTSSDLDRFAALCWTTSFCMVSFSVNTHQCGSVQYPSVQAYYTYFCADVNPSLAIGESGSWTGVSLTARYSPPQPTFAPANVTWECSVEAWDCSSVNVTLLLFIRNGNVKLSYFTVSGTTRRVGGPSAYGHAEIVVRTPFRVFLNLEEESLIQNAYIAVQAQQTLSLVCRQLAGFPPQPVGRQCDINECGATPPPCDVTARCNNTEGSFHCYCDAGFTLTDNGRGCTGPSTPASQSQTSAVGPAVGATVGGLVIAVIVVVIVVAVRRNRTSKMAAARGREARLAGGQSQRVNMAFSDSAIENEGQEQASPDYLTPIPEPPTSSSSAVTSHADQHYYNMADTGVPSNAEGAYGRLDPGSRDDVRAANTYQALGSPSAGGQSGDVTYESLDRDSRDDVSTATPYQALTSAVSAVEDRDLSGDVTTAYESLDRASRDDVSMATPYQALTSAVSAVEDTDQSGDVSPYAAVD